MCVCVCEGVCICVGGVSVWKGGEVILFVCEYSVVVVTVRVVSTCVQSVCTYVCFRLYCRRRQHCCCFRFVSLMGLKKFSFVYFGLSLFLLLHDGGRGVGRSL